MHTSDVSNFIMISPQFKVDYFDKELHVIDELNN